MQKKYMKGITFCIVCLVSIMMISTATAVPQVQSKTIKPAKLEKDLGTRSLDLKEKILSLFEKLKVLNLNNLEKTEDISDTGFGTTLLEILIEMIKGIIQLVIILIFTIFEPLIEGILQLGQILFGVVLGALQLIASIPQLIVKFFQFIGLMVATLLNIIALMLCWLIELLGGELPSLN